jgi:O-antigen/teichoic acid export membrane protein
MAEEISEISVGQFDTVSQLIASSVSLQLAVIGLIIGIIIISVVYRKFSFWIKTQKFNHTKPHVARFARKIILPFLAIALISSVNMYIQVFELFDEESAVLQIIQKLECTCLQMKLKQLPKTVRLFFLQILQRVVLCG